MKRLAALTVLLVALAGCKGATPIKEVLDDPSKFGTKPVRIAGTVTKAVAVMGVGAYQVKDDTGTLTVVAETAAPPPKGSTTGVKGVFQSLVTLGSRSLAVLEEHERF